MGQSWDQMPPSPEPPDTRNCGTPDGSSCSPGQQDVGTVGGPAPGGRGGAGRGSAAGVRDHAPARPRGDDGSSLLTPARVLLPG